MALIDELSCESAPMALPNKMSCDPAPVKTETRYVVKYYLDTENGAVRLWRTVEYAASDSLHDVFKDVKLAMNNNPLLCRAYVSAITYVESELGYFERGRSNG